MLRERVYSFEGTSLRYLHYPCPRSNTLVVVFSACTKAGVPARYNYIRTLQGIPANRLYILDDGAEDRRGTFYLGAYPAFQTEKAVEQLIEDVMRKRGIETMIFTGSSKGGWAALNFAAHFGGAVKAVVVGAPQYYLGYYLSKPANKITLNCIAGDQTQMAVEELDQHLKRKLHQLSQTKVYLHYSTQEHTYTEHIKALLEALSKITTVEADVESYTAHDQVGQFFPPFLKKCVAECLAETDK